MENSKKKKIILLTEAYPYVSLEETFLLPELRRLSKIYDITVIACGLAEEPSTIECELPDGIHSNYYIGKRSGLDVSYYKHIAFRFSGSHKGETKPDISYYIKGMLFEKWFRNKGFVDKNEDFVVYSYWYMWWVLGFCENRKKYPNMRLITRTHNYDLFDVRRKDGKQPFRRFMDSMLDRVLFVSEEGYQYYLTNMANKPVDGEKYIVNYLGQEDCLDNVPERSEEFLLVSCSYVKPIKRVDLIEKALREIKTEKRIRWVHFGNGILLDELRESVEELQIIKSNVVVELKGRLPNEKVMEFYNNNHVDCFITTSAIEGLPVSISEAMSFGIPIIATAVNGIVEQVEDNGILLSANPQISEITEAIEKMISLPEEKKLEMRSQSRTIWERKFGADINAEKLISEIERMF